MQIYRGSTAASPFRLNKLLPTLKAIAPNLEGLQAQYLHFVHVADELTADEQEQLRILMGHANERPGSSNENLLLVTPRPGTISPWSSKATDILHNCGLTKVNRIERGTAWYLDTSGDIPEQELIVIAAHLHDRMTESVLLDPADAEQLFSQTEPEIFTTIDLTQRGKDALIKANTELGLALSDLEMDYLLKSYQELARDPTDVELMMFAQANSEHCRHKIFNARWTIAENEQDQTLFGMIRQTHEKNPGRVLSAYHDNAAVSHGYESSRFFPDPKTGDYRYHPEDVHLLMKVETHNHPTAISPFPGAATGSGGEIRDEAATGRGAKPKAGLTGFSVSNLRIPGFIQPWEQEYGKPGRIVSALDIMLEGPIGGAAFNNEFGRPALCGYFRSYEQAQPCNDRIRGYHKPIMLAGGYGMIRPQHVHKQPIQAGTPLIVLGGPAMLIGLGGGAASSQASGTSHEDLDFASVQRHNPEMQRRCQEVIDQCWSLGDQSPIISIHDVGAGGLSNALPELVNDSDRGAQFELRKIPNAEPGMSPMEIWCNEAQERYVLAIAEDRLELFEKLCRRERAPYAVIGRATAETRLVLNDELFKNKPIDMPLPVLLGKLPQMHRTVSDSDGKYEPFDTSHIQLEDAIQRLLQLPTISDKRFLITIGDRTVSGLVVRDQMVGPWQIPVADCAVTNSGFNACVGEAMAVGERTPIALIDAPASGRIALGEAITNLAAARILQLEDVALSANWMAACGQLDEDARLFHTVTAVSQLCQELGICIPVGKDSLSMNTQWQEQGQSKQVTAPLSLVVSAFAPVADTRQSLTPQLRTDQKDSLLLLIDLGRGQNRIGGSCLTQVYNHIGGTVPDLDHSEDLKRFFRSIQLLNEMGLILAYHDRSDGGLFITLVEMCLASRSGINVDINPLGDDVMASLFNEELGAVIQIPGESLEAVREVFANCAELADHVHVIGELNTQKTIQISQNRTEIIGLPLTKAQQLWSNTSFHMQSLRDNPDCARQEYDLVCNLDDPGLFVETPLADDTIRPMINTGIRPRVAILREQGVNGHVEMAAAFDRAGFTSVDVHMSDIIHGKIELDSFSGLVACGGFSYGDVLGAGGGWAKSILFNPQLREIFTTFFNRNDSFALGVCNGCQMLSQLRELIPGADHWPEFVRNESEQFEARLVMVEVTDSPSILFQGMQGSKVPIVVAHGEGRVAYIQPEHGHEAIVSLRYVDNHGQRTEHYPGNPNGSTQGETGFTTTDGRFTIMMPHPERVFLKQQFSWFPDHWASEYSPWMALFNNARKWCD